MFPHSHMTALWIGILATGGLASHRSAAQLHGLVGADTAQTPELVVAHGRWRAVTGVIVHQSAQIDRVDHVVIQGVPCTGLARTVLDLGVSMRPRKLDRVVDDLLRKKLIKQAELWDVLIRHSGFFLGQIDLAYPQAMLAIELDSVGFHNNLDSFHGDRARARQLTVEGWSVLQFTWEDYTKRPDQMVAQVRGILSRRRAA